MSCIVLVSDCLHYYITPALDNQFYNFEITTSIPSDGKGGCKFVNIYYAPNFEKVEGAYSLGLSVLPSVHQSVRYKGRVTVWPFFGPRWIWLTFIYMVVLSLPFHMSMFLN